MQNQTRPVTSEGWETGAPGLPGVSQADTADSAVMATAGNNHLHDLTTPPACRHHQAHHESARHTDRQQPMPANRPDRGRVSRARSLGTGGRLDSRPRERATQGLYPDQAIRALQSDTPVWVGGGRALNTIDSRAAMWRGHA